MWGFWEITDPAAAPGVDVAELRSCRSSRYKCWTG